MRALASFLLLTILLPASADVGHPEWSLEAIRAKTEAGPSFAGGWENFRWDSAAGYGVIFAICITAVSWIFVGYALWNDGKTHNYAPKARSADAAKWLLQGCPGSEVGTISEINLYPVKSCKQHPVSEVRVLDRGLEGDRVAMVVRASDYDFVTQRQVPRLALVTTSGGEGSLHFTAPGKEKISVVLNHKGETKGANGARCDIKATLWEEPVNVVDQGDSIAEWLSSFLETDVRLVCLAEDEKPMTEDKFAEGFETGLTDGYPVLVISEAGLDLFNKQLKNPVEMKRFRPNIVVSGTNPFAEDTWRIWRIGGKNGVVFQNVKPCSRCGVPNVIPEEGIPGDGEVISVLNKKRKGRKIGVGEWGHGQVFLGQNAVNLTSALGPATIKVGDMVEVLEFESKEKIVGARPDLKMKDMPASAL